MAGRPQPPRLDNMTSSQRSAPPARLRIMTQGPVPDSEREYAREKVLRVSRLARRPVLDAHAELRQEANPSLERPAIAKATLDVGGRRVRAHVVARDMHEAIDLLEARLRQRLRTLVERERALVHEGAAQAGGEWRHGDLASHRPEFQSRAVEEREVRRVKSLSPTPLTPDQAALEMTALSYDFFLFHDAASGVEIMLYRGADGHLVLKGKTAGDPGPFDVDPISPRTDASRGSRRAPQPQR